MEDVKNTSCIFLLWKNQCFGNKPANLIQVLAPHFLSPLRLHSGHQGDGTNHNRLGLEVGFHSGQVIGSSLTHSHLQTTQSGQLLKPPAVKREIVNQERRWMVGYTV